MVGDKSRLHQVTGLGTSQSPNTVKQLLRKAVEILRNFGRSYGVVQRLTRQRQYVVKVIGQGLFSPVSFPTL